MVKRGIGWSLIAVGVVLLLGALLLFLHNKRESDAAGESANQVLMIMEAQLEEKAAEATEAQEAIPETIPEPTELTPVQIGGNWYIGYLRIPALEMELPIAETISDAMLQVAPCLEYGSPLTNDAVIAGHNYKKHFLPLHNIEVGTGLSFTDMTGYVIGYEVAEVKIVAPTSVAEVIESEYDLILYTCTSGGGSRVLVCCNRESGNAA